MSLLFNMLFRLVLAFFPRSKRVLISWLQSPSAVILKPKKRKSVSISTFPHLFAMKCCDQMPWSSFFERWVLSQLFYSPLSPSIRGSLVPLCFLPLKWYHLPISGCWYFSQQSWLQFVSHSAQHFTWYSAYKLNKQGDNTLMYSFSKFEQVSCFMSSSVGSCPAYRFLRRQVRWSGIPISLRIFHSLLWSTQSKALVKSMKQKYMFFGTPFLFHDPTDVGNLISGSSAFSKPSFVHLKVLGSRAAEA